VQARKEGVLSRVVRVWKLRALARSFAGWHEGALERGRMRVVSYSALVRVMKIGQRLRCYRIFNMWRFMSFRFAFSYSSISVMGQRRFTFLKQKLFFQLWRNLFIYRSRCSLILSVFAARRNARVVSLAFRSLRSFPNFSMRPGKSPALGGSFLVSRHALNRDFFFLSDVFCTWRRAMHSMRRFLFARSRAFAMRPILLQWQLAAVQQRPSAMPSRAMHFSELLRAQSVSREILLHPSTLLAARKQYQAESSLNHPYWSLPMQPTQSIVESSPRLRNVSQPHVISATSPVTPTRLLAQQPSQKPMRVAVTVRPPWVPPH
jgi:hypothetical protein